jgi:hypothetical protein
LWSSGRSLRAPLIFSLSVGQWTLGYSQSTGASILKLEFTDREPLNLAIPPGHAVAIAKAILEQQANPPPPPHRLS